MTTIHSGELSPSKKISPVTSEKLLFRISPDNPHLDFLFENDIIVYHLSLEELSKFSEYYEELFRAPDSEFCYEYVLEHAKQSGFFVAALKEAFLH